jgi:hypothetical protein
VQAIQKEETSQEKREKAGSLILAPKGAFFIFLFGFQHRLSPLNLLPAVGGWLVSSGLYQKVYNYFCPDLLTKEI